MNDTDKDNETNRNESWWRKKCAWKAVQTNRSRATV